MNIGSYEVLFELARGGMGKVYLARSVGPGGVERLVAIKRAHEQVDAGSRIFSERLMDEACMAAHVHHSNVVGVHQAGSDDGGYYLVLDYVEGESLRGLLDAALKRGERFPARIALRIVCDALAGLHAAHEAKDAQGRSLGILHRDVSTHNLLIGRDGVTRLADFGIAKSALSRVVTAEQYVQGKLVYMAPEYLRREPVDRTLDVYAMGITLWIALTGRSPWPGVEGPPLLHAIVLSNMPSFGQRAPELGAELAAVIDRACHPDARKRFRTAREMLDALEATGTAPGIARHVEVAELVEALVGPELSDRRKRVNAWREAIDRGGNTARAQAQPAPRALVQADGPGGVAPVEVRISSDGSRSRWVTPLPWRAALSLVLGGAVLLGAFFTYRSRRAPSADEGRSRIAPAASQSAASTPAPTVPVIAHAIPIEASAAAASERHDPPAASAASAVGGRRQRTPRPPSSAKTVPFSNVNPYR